VKIFKYPNATYLNQSTLLTIVKRVNKYVGKYERSKELKTMYGYLVLYCLRILNVNFNALMKCHGNLKTILGQQWHKF